MNIPLANIFVNSFLKKILTAVIFYVIVFIEEVVPHKRPY